MTDTKIAIVFTKPDCPFCVKAANLLFEKGIHQIKRTVDVEFTREELLGFIPEELRPAKLTFPQIFISGFYVGGYDNLVNYLRFNE